jgi:transcriptional regulator with XRE-family HTH domain
MFSASFGKAIKAVRLARNLTGRRLAKMLGISAPYLSQLESDRAVPSERLARKFATLFGQDVDQLLFLARRVPAQLGAVLDKFPSQVSAYLDDSESKLAPQNRTQRSVPMVRVIEASEKQVRFTNYAAVAGVVGRGDDRPPKRGYRPGLPDAFDSIRPSIVAFASRAAMTAPGGTPLFPSIIGTGFVVDSSGIVVTNKHVVDLLQALPPNPETGARSDMAIVWSNIERRNEGHFQPLLFIDVKAYSVIQSFSTVGPYYGETVPDLAFVQLNAKDLPAVTLAAEPNTLRAGMPVATAGFPLGTDPLVGYGHVTQLSPFLRQGIVSSLYPFPCPNPHGFTVDIMTQGGASGSPVFLADSPEVVGIIHAGIPGTNVTVAIPSLLIRDALNACTNGSSLDLNGVPTLQSLLEVSERSSELRWQSFAAKKPSTS